MVLLLVAGNALVNRKGDIDWSIPHSLRIYPINGDHGAKTAAYINALSSYDFTPIGEFINQESRPYNLPGAEPVSVDLGPEVKSLPPPTPFGGSRFAIVLWSIRMRWWAFRHDKNNDIAAARMFVIYFDPATSGQLGHSLGLTRGRMGVVKGYGSRLFSARNKVVITHEYLHILGATDKYDPADGMPIYPLGYAAPDAVPRYPQKAVEIMGGLVPVTSDEGVMPEGLWQTVIGPITAREIGWIGE